MAAAGMRTTVSIQVEDHRRLRAIAEQHGWTMDKTTSLAIGVLESLTEEERADAEYRDELAKLNARHGMMVTAPITNGQALRAESRVGEGRNRP